MALSSGLFTFYLPYLHISFPLAPLPLSHFLPGLFYFVNMMLPRAELLLLLRLFAVIADENIFNLLYSIWRHLFSVDIMILGGARACDMRHAA